MKVIKRNGTETTFDESRISMAVIKANNACSVKELSNEQVLAITSEVSTECRSLNRTISVEEIRDMVELSIMRQGAYHVAQCYSHYRSEHNASRKGNTTDGKILSLLSCNNEEALQENSNKDPIINSVQRDYLAGETSRDITERLLLPEHIVKAHREGIIHFHDTDYYAQHMHNCCLVNLKDMLLNGTVISDTYINTPHSFSTACNIAMQIVAQVTSNQYGGQSISMAHLVPFVQKSREQIAREVLEDASIAGELLDADVLDRIVDKRLRKEINKGVQTIQYQVITLMTTNGQAPFLSVFLYLGEVDTPQEKDDLALIIEEMLNQRILGVKNQTGVYITPAFPKLLYVLEEDNVHEDGEYQYYGRFNQGVVTINLPDVALSAGCDLEKFWDVFHDRLELCFEALMCRHNRLKGTLSDAAPILWQHGALARLPRGAVIDPLLYDGYSTSPSATQGLQNASMPLQGSHIQTRRQNRWLFIS